MKSEEWFPGETVDLSALAQVPARFTTRDHRSECLDNRLKRRVFGEFRMVRPKQHLRSLANRNGGKVIPPQLPSPKIVAEELKRLGLAEGESNKRRKGDREKAQIARRLRRETIVTLGWIAERLRMGSVSMVVHCLRQQGY